MCDVSVKTVRQTFIDGLTAPLRERLLLVEGAHGMEYPALRKVADRLFHAMVLAKADLGSNAANVAAIFTLLADSDYSQEEVRDVLAAAESDDGKRKRDIKMFDGDSGTLLATVKKNYTAGEWSKRCQVIAANTKLTKEHDHLFCKDKIGKDFVCITCRKFSTRLRVAATATKSNVGNRCLP